MESEHDNLVINNVLSYISTALDYKSTEYVVSMCSSFYNIDAISEARTIIDSIADNRKLRKRNQSLIHIEVFELVELFKKCLSNNTKLPKFVAFGFNAMPSDDLQSVAKQFEYLRDDFDKVNDDIKTIKSSILDNMIIDSNLALKEDVMEIKNILKVIKNSDLRDGLRRSSDMYVNNVADEHDISIYVKPTAPTLSQMSDQFNELELDNCNLDCNLDIIPTLSKLCRTSIGDKTKMSNLNDEPQSENYKPSAPTLSQFSCTNTVLKSCSYATNSHYGNEISQPTAQHSYSSKVKSIINTFNEASPRQPPTKTTPIIKVKTTDSQFKPRIKKDEDGFITVVSRRNLRNITKGTRQPKSCLLKSAEKTVDMYIGRCDVSMTTDDVMNYINNELDVKGLSCINLQSRNPFSKSFKLTVRLNDRDTLLTDDSWPEGVICRKYYSKRF